MIRYFELSKHLEWHLPEKGICGSLNAAVCPPQGKKGPLQNRQWVAWAASVSSSLAAQGQPKEVQAK